MVEYDLLKHNNSNIRVYIAINVYSLQYTTIFNDILMFDVYVGKFKYLCIYLVINKYHINRSCHLYSWWLWNGKCGMATDIIMSKMWGVKFYSTLIVWKWKNFIVERPVHVTKVLAILMAHCVCCTFQTHDS